MDQTLIPQRFRETSFRYYEKYIAAAVNGFPKPVILDPRILCKSIETLAARLRDALTSYERYQWQTSLFTPTVFQAARAQGLTVRQDLDNGVVVIGSKETVKTAKVAPLPESFADVPDTETIHTHSLLINTYDEFAHIALLASDRILLHPLRLQVDNPSWVQKILTSYDVDLEQVEETSTYIIR
jgi:hypothetical protein